MKSPTTEMLNTDGQHTPARWMALIAHRRWDLILARLRLVNKTLANGESCPAPGCAYHISIPCPACGRHMAHGEFVYGRIVPCTSGQCHLKEFGWQLQRKVKWNLSHRDAKGSRESFRTNLDPAALHLLLAQWREKQRDTNQMYDALHSFSDQVRAEVIKECADDLENVLKRRGSGAHD